MNTTQVSKNLWAVTDKSGGIWSITQVKVDTQAGALVARAGQWVLINPSDVVDSVHDARLMAVVTAARG